ncbi:MAG TPA: DEAD/DEAH box helicase, partial [Myxococcaceae bacterium]|nr:DEAD/DEAH box helicase [Myxococcaceae bacterium]
VPEPSVFAHQMVNSQPYTFLDEAPAEVRRVRNVVLRRTLPAEDAASFGALDGEAIEQVVRDAAPPMRDEDELHDALLQLVVMREEDVPRAFVTGLMREGRVAWLEVGGGRFLIPAERVGTVRALFPEARMEPELERLPGDREVERDVAVQQVVRGWMEMGGPTTAAELSSHTAMDESEVNLALHQLEATGGILRGRFRPQEPLSLRERDGVRVPETEGSQEPLSLWERDGVRVSESPSPIVSPVEWCDRRLLQRIHRLTVGRLRKEIEPLSARDFMRFLFRWHHLEEVDALRGGTGLAKAISLLQGYEAPASAWERYLLPARMKGYLGDLLERACYGGEVAWGRLTLKDAKPAPGPRRGAPASPPPEAPRARAATPNRNASLTFVKREDLDWLLWAARPNAVLSDGGLSLPSDLSGPAQDVVGVLEQRGACFFNDLVTRTRRLPAEVEDALWELVARGLVTADAVQNLRVLQSPAQRKRQKLLQRGGPGRWSLLVPSEQRSQEDVLGEVAKLFLPRYGIVWRDLVMRESLAPSGRELLYVYRRLEARGEIRGGRFVGGFVGEQFSLTEAVDMARAERRKPPSGVRVRISAVDPLNLTGVVTPGPRVPAMVGNLVTYVDGVPQGVDAPGDEEEGEVVQSG